MLSRAEIFENGDSSYVFVWTGENAGGFFKYDDVMPTVGSRLALPHLRFENATCRRRFV